MLKRISIFLWVNLWWEEMERRLARLGFRRVSRIEFGFVKWEWETRDCETFLLMPPLFSCFSVISFMKEWESFLVYNKVSSNKKKVPLQKLSLCWLRLSLSFSRSWLANLDERLFGPEPEEWRWELKRADVEQSRREASLESSRLTFLTFFQTFSMGKSTGSPCQS